MATRTSFRPRPLDLHKQLSIVRDLKDLDSTEGLVAREITHNHEALDKENEEVLGLTTWLYSFQAICVSMNLAIYTFRSFF